MDQITAPIPATRTPEEIHEVRKRTLVDVLYLLMSAWLYYVSLIAPLGGFTLGIILTSWAGTDETRRLGRTCLILGVVNLVFVLGIAAVMVATGDLLSRLPFGRWEGL